MSTVRKRWPDEPHLLAPAAGSGSPIRPCRSCCAGRPLRTPSSTRSPSRRIRGSPATSCSTPGSRSRSRHLALVPGRARRGHLLLGGHAAGRRRAEGPPLRDPLLQLELAERHQPASARPVGGRGPVDLRGPAVRVGPDPRCGALRGRGEHLGGVRRRLQGLLHRPDHRHFAVPDPAARRTTRTCRRPGGLPLAGPRHRSRRQRRSMERRRGSSRRSSTTCRPVPRASDRDNTGAAVPGERPRPRRSSTGTPSLARRATRCTWCPGSGRLRLERRHQLSLGRADAIATAKYRVDAARIQRAISGSVPGVRSRDRQAGTTEVTEASTALACGRERAPTPQKRVVSDWTQLGGFTPRSPMPPRRRRVAVPHSPQRLPDAPAARGPQGMPLFTWKHVPGACGYFVAVARDENFTTVVDVARTKIPAYAPRLRTYPDETPPTTGPCCRVAAHRGAVRPRLHHPARQQSPDFEKRSTPPALPDPDARLDASTSPPSAGGRFALGPSASRPRASTGSRYPTIRPSRTLIDDVRTARPPTRARPPTQLTPMSSGGSARTTSTGSA